MAAAFEGDTEMPATCLATRSLTIWISSSPPPCSGGPMYWQVILPLDSAWAFMQPSRAWSKNGLLRFFGTSAKVRLSAAWPPGAAKAASATPAAAHKRSFFIDF